MVTSMTAALISVSVHHTRLFRVERDPGRHLVLSQTQSKKESLYITQLPDTGSPVVSVPPPFCKPFFKQATYIRWRKRHDNQASTFTLTRCGSFFEKSWLRPCCEIELEKSVNCRFVQCETEAIQQNRNVRET